MKYAPVNAGGTFEHRSWDCPTHGCNVPFFKRYKGRPGTEAGRWQCVACNTEWYAQVCENPVARVYHYTRVVVAGGQWLRGLLPTTQPLADANAEAP